MTKYTKLQRMQAMERSVYKAMQRSTMKYYMTMGGTTSTPSAMYDWYDTTSTGGTINIAYNDVVGWEILPQSVVDNDRRRRLVAVNDRLQLTVGEPLDIVLPDGAVLKLDAQGNYVLEDASAKVHYKANRHREFNPFVNAGDLVARFIDYVGSLGVKREEVATLPLKLFVNWLVVEAAEKDGDAIPEGVAPVIPLLRGQVLHPHCLACGRFVRRSQNLRGVAFCSGEHAAQYITRKAA